jgi:putative transposase
MADKKKHGKRYSEEQIVRVLQEVEKGMSITEVCREHGISDQTYRNWRKRYGGMDVSDVKEMRRLAAENARLKRIVADQALTIQMLEDVNSKKW